LTGRKFDHPRSVAEPTRGVAYYLKEPATDKQTTYLLLEMIDKRLDQMEQSRQR
jgi:hypothetical protein